MGNRFTRHLADPVGAELNPLQRLVDLVKRILFLGKQAEGEVAIVGIAPCIRLVHAERRGFAAFRARTQIVFRDSRHRIDHRVAQLQKFVFLAANERIELALFEVFRSQDCLTGISRIEILFRAIGLGRLTSPGRRFLGRNGRLFRHGFLRDSGFFAGGFSPFHCL